MNKQRRKLLQVLAVGGGACAAASLWMIPSRLAFAATNASFDTQGVQQLLSQMGADDAIQSADIVLNTPEIAENGTMVRIMMHSKIPGTDYIALVVDKNPIPLLAEFDILEGALPYAEMRIKMRESSTVRAVIKANGKFYTASNEVKVTIGGCGG